MSVFLLVVLSSLLIVCFFAAVVLASFGATAVFGSPFVGTSSELATLLLERSRLKRGDVFVDIGSGTGTFLIEAVRFGAKRAVGYEINPILVIYSRLRVRILGLSHCIEVKTANIFHQPLVACDVIAVYLLPPMMARLEKKLVAELRGAHCISRGFPFPQLQPVETWDDDGRKAFLYKFDS